MSAPEERGLHERLRAGLGDRAEVVDQFLLVHADTRVPDRQSVVGLVRDYLDVEVRLEVQARTLLVRDRFISDFIESVGGVRNQFSQENFFVGVESVDDQTH
jgi:DNA-dependent RNA polymerase auxiliary subunit epsilon